MHAWLVQLGRHLQSTTSCLWLTVKEQLLSLQSAGNVLHAQWPSMRSGELFADVYDVTVG